MKTKQLLKSEILHIVVLLILFSAGGYFLYQNQHQQVDNLTSQNGKLDTANKTQAKQISSLQSNSDSLSKQNIVLQNQVDAYKKVSSVVIPQPSYMLKVNSVKQYFSPALLADNTYMLLVIDVSVTNTGNATGYVNPSDFVVKDSNNVSQQTIDQWFGSHQTVYLPPSQPSALSAQSLNTSDTVRGSLIFHTLTSKTSFVLTYNSKNLPITVDGQLTTQG